MEPSKKITGSLKGRTKVTAQLISQRFGRTFDRILVVGCGTGIEVAVLAQEFNATVVGIDIDRTIFDPWAVRQVELRVGDATNLEFNNDEFDFIYSFHVLEHIPNYQKALTEMARVLKQEGGYLIGVPNRARLIGYMGSETASWVEKVVWNWADWKARMRGRFKNEDGAHAGFLPQELKAELRKVFSKTEEVTLQYYLELYERHPVLVRYLDRSGLGGYLFPAIFFAGKK